MTAEPATMQAANMHTPVGRLAHPDKSPRVANRAPHVGAAESSSFDTVSHYFNAAADRLGLADDLRTVVQTAYREVQVQVPVTARGGDGQATVARRLAGPRRRHRPWRRVLLPRGGQRARSAPGRHQGCSAGIWERRLMGSAKSSRRSVASSLAYRTAIHPETGIDPRGLVAHLADGGTLIEYPATAAVTPEELMSLHCEVFVPTALGGTIHAGNADSIRARIVIEGANNPTTPTAGAILRDMGVLVISPTCSPISSGCRTCGAGAPVGSRYPEITVTRS